MAECDICKTDVPRGRLHRRLQIPEYRSMIGFWPWVVIRVCDQCVTAHDRNLRQRVHLLARDVVENDEPIVRRVCVACGEAETDVAWHQASKWLDAGGRPVRRCTFYLCGDHAGAVYAEGIVVSSNLTGRGPMARLVDELPTVSPSIVERTERWNPGAGGGPPEADGFTPDRSRDAAVAAALAWWLEAPDGLEAKAAWLGPMRQDYKMRYRLDLARDFADGRRETLVVLRTGPEALATYRLAGEAVVGRRLA
ncbi:MAG: hypothetical protein R6X20_13205 [Phycisphaerae bacterium]